MRERELSYVQVREGFESEAASEARIRRRIERGWIERILTQSTLAQHSAQHALRQCAE